jgi:hypothetical protein
MGHYLIRLLPLLALLLAARAFAWNPEEFFGPDFSSNYAAIEKTFAGLKRTNPDRVQRQIIGKTLQGRDLAVYTLGNPKATSRVLLLCNHHGDEQWVAQLCVDFSKFLLGSEEPTAKAVRGKVAFDVLPLGNPDGFEVKSRYNARGIDINRNFPFMWGYKEPGTVNPHPGPHAASEAETTALQNYQLSHLGHWIAVLNYHLSYPDSDERNYILLPWAYTRHKKLTAQENERYRPFLPVPGESKFIVDTVPNVFYPCSGTHTDWSWKILGVPALTMELGHGYNLPTRTKYFATHLRENLEVFRRFLTGIHETNSLRSFE